MEALSKIFLGAWRHRKPHMLEFGLRWPPETFLASKLERLAARGYRVTVVVGRGDSGRPLPGVDVLALIPRGRSRLPHLAAAAALVPLLVRSPRRAAAVVRAAGRPTAAGKAVTRRQAIERVRTYARLAAIRPDVIHFEWATGAIRFHSLGDALGCPVVVSCRGTDVNVHPYTVSMREVAAGLRLALGRATAVHCVSEAMRQEALTHGLDPVKTWLIRPAVDPTFFHPPRLPSVPGDRYRLVAVGSLRWRKGFEYALLAVDALVREGIPVSLDIIGDDPAAEVGETSERERLRSSITDLGLQDRVRLRGQLEPADVLTALQQSDVLLHTSLSEGLPNSVLEAMACGLAVVATDVGGTREAVRDGIEGFLVPARDIGATVSALRALWQEPELRARMGVAGRARVEAEFTVERQIDRWVELYEHVATTRERSAPRALRLAEVGIRWPPETFLQRELENLAASGLDPRIVSAHAPRKPSSIPGVTLERLPGWSEASGSLLGALLDAGVLLVRHPRRLRSLLAARRALSRKGPGLPRLSLRLARLRADIVHFEWLQTATAFLPLLETWDCPVIVSRRGAQLQVRPHTPRGEREHLRERIPRVFAGAAAVHCVSEAVRREAAGYGLDPAKTWLIRSAVDSAFFHPPRFPRTSGRLRIASVGVLRWVKGFEFALLAVAALVREGCPVFLEIAGGDPPDEAGEASERERLLSAIAALGLGGPGQPTRNRCAIRGTRDASTLRCIAPCEPERGSAELRPRGDGLRAAHRGDRRRRDVRGVQRRCRRLPGPCKGRGGSSVRPEEALARARPSPADGRRRPSPRAGRVHRGAGDSSVDGPLREPRSCPERGLDVGRPGRSIRPPSLRATRSFPASSVCLRVGGTHTWC